MGTLFIVAVHFSFGSALVLLVTLPLLVTPPLDAKGSQSFVLLVILPLDAEGVSCLHRLYSLVTPPMDGDGGQSLQLSALLVTPALDSQGKSVVDVDSLFLEGVRGIKMQFRVLTCGLPCSLVKAASL